MKSIDDMKPENLNHAMDLRGHPIYVCPCGSDVWNVKCKFDEGEIAFYFLDMSCVLCGTLATAPTPMDKELF